MLNLKKTWWKILILVLIATIVNVAGHIIEGSPLPDVDPLSIISKIISFEAAVSIYFIIFFSGLSVLFLIIEKWMRGNGIIKGLKFGISWGIIAFFGVVEVNPIFGVTSLVSDLRVGLVDAIPVVLLGIVLGKLFASDSRNEQESKNGIASSLIIITLFYVIGRYLAYSILKIESGYIERPALTFVWTLCTGISFGILYILAGRHVNGMSQIKKSIFFGVIIAGINWIFINLFWPFVFQVSILRFISIVGGRAIVDIIFITLGVYCSEKILNKKAVKISNSY